MPLSEHNHAPLETQERRKTREPIIHVWDWVVRIGHWLLVLSFAIIYLRYRKFPIHTYAGYTMTLVLLVRFVWGFVGSPAARFRTFFFPPRVMMNYARDALHGHAGYYASHNPMGAYMVFLLFGLLAMNCFLGLLLYSATQQLGPFGASVPDTWDINLEIAHRMLGHMTAIAVSIHIVGVLWAARLHRENYAIAMLTGCKRIPRSAGSTAIESYPFYPESRIPKLLAPIERWFNFRHPFLGSVVATLLVAGAIYGLMLYLVSFNSQLYFY